MTDWVIKSVSIEHSDAEIIRRQGPRFNLSRFVRECLRRHDTHEKLASMLHRQPGIQERLGVCLPRSTCPVCWPEGFPSEANFDLFMGKETTPGMPYTGPEVENLDWLRSTISPAFDIAGIEAKGNAKPNSNPKPDSFIGKWLKKLRNDA